MRSLLAARGFALLAILTLAHCSSDSNDAANGAPNGGMAGSGVSSGGSSSAGRSAQGGSAGAPTGGAASSVGGAAVQSGGKAGAPATTGGAASTGGTTSGGTTAGGTTSAGAGGTSGASGGSAKAGAGGGGASAGGAGGTATGGATAGGVAGSQSGSGGLPAGGAAGGKGFSPCTAGTPCAVLPLGDSITEGYASSGGGYRVELFRQAVKNGKGLTFVGTLQNGPNEVEGKMFPKRHQGHGGYTIDSGAGHNGISGQITSQALAQNPKIVLLMIGTNDINGNVDVAAAPTRLGKLIDDITTTAPDALVVVATIIPVVNDGTDQRIKAYNAAIPGLVSMRAAAGKHVQLLDIYGAVAKEPNYETALMADNLHPNDAGYAVLGRTFYDAIASFLPSAP